MDSESSIEALAWMRRQVEQGISPAGVTDVRAPFKNGSEVLMPDLPAAIPDLQETAGDLEWGVAAFPQIGDQPGTFANSHNFVLTTQSQRDDHVAHAVMIFLGWIGGHSAGWSAGGNVPASNAARKQPEFIQSVQAPIAEAPAYEESLFFLPAVPNSREIAANSYERAVSQVVLGQEKPADAARMANRNAQDQLDDLRKVYGI